MNKIQSLFLNAFFPPVCFGCGSFGIELCNKCLTQFEPINTYRCLLCEEEVSTFEKLCSCRGEAMFGVVYPIWKYKGPIKKTITNLKYGSHKEALLPLITLMRPSQLSKIISLIDTVQNPLLIPVPSHPNKLRSRGFNQAELFAKSLGAMLGVEVAREGVVLRKKQLRTQASLKQRSDRIINATGSFEIAERQTLIGRGVVIIDDVLTSGSTLREIARLIHPHTASRANCVVLAHEEDAI